MIGTKHEPLRMLAAISLAIVVSVIIPTPLLARSLPVAHAAISGPHAAVWVAKEAGYFDKQGMTIDLIYLGGGQATKVLVSGSATFISISETAPITAAVKKSDSFALWPLCSLWLIS
jgi:ABC-type nitrate/sulfonate/bicarbonate transport system substrate-binding protein